MAVTKSIVKRRCPASGRVSRKTTLSFNGAEVDQDILIRQMIDLVKELCPDPNGTLSFKLFFDRLVVESMLEDLLEKNDSRKQFKSFVKHMLTNVINYLSDQDQEVEFVKEVTLEERNRIGFANAIIL